MSNHLPLPKPHVLDLRSLALIRILLGLLQLYDVYSRTSNGKYDMAWYTSHPSERSYQPNVVPDHVNDGLPGIFPFLFTRHSTQVEYIQMGIYAVLAIFMIVGFKARCTVPAMWILCSALVTKAEAITDGSDVLLLQMLLFLSFLPTSQRWSVDAYVTSRRSTQDNYYRNNQVANVACICLTLQIVMMYLGCFFDRTFDNYTVNELIEGGVSDWMWPDYELVHYASNGGGVFKTYISDVIRNTPSMNRFMTFSGFLIELLCPLFCFVFNQRYSHWGAIPLIMLHLGIGQIINIPHWVILGCSIHVIWIPTHVWDRLLGVKHLHTAECNQEQRPALSLHATHEAFSNGIALFLLYLLVTTWGASRGWFPESMSNSELATSLGFRNSNWAMWHSAPRESPFTMIVGYRPPSTEVDPDGDWEALNLYHFMKTGKQVPFLGFTDEALDAFTYEYPSTRWEKGIGDEWETYLGALVEPMSEALCVMVNEDLKRFGADPIHFIHFAVHIRGIMPPGSETRWQQDEGPASTQRRRFLCNYLELPD